MGKKLRTVPGGAEFCPEGSKFDWSLYEDGYNGASLQVNRRVIVNGKKEKVYCHGDYAQKLYDMFSEHFEGRKVESKETKVGSTYHITDITKSSDHEIRVDSDSGISSVIDLNKEGKLIKLLGLDNARQMVDLIATNEEYKKSLIEKNLVAKVVDKTRVSIWEGYLSTIESQLMEDLTRKEGPKYAYNANILSVNNGGYTVDVMGLKCFLPISLASSSPVSDVESLLGTNVKVCVVNYSPITRNFVVSHKKYLDVTLPTRIMDEIYVGKEVFAKVTGISKNGIFCALKDNEGNFTFTSLMHRSTMSKSAESSLDNGEYSVGDQFRAYVWQVNWINEKQCRIVIGDCPYVEPEKKDDKRDDRKDYKRKKK